MLKFVNLLEREISMLFLIVFPPWGEEKESDIDISIGFVFSDEPDVLCVISVDKDDLWLPNLFYQPLPKVEYAWEDYYPLIKKWMNMIDTDDDFEHIYFNVTNCVLFENFVNSKINSIELINIMGTPDPFGVKLNFEDDYIISMPISDGNTIETSRFHQHNNMDNYRSLGAIEFKRLVKI